MILSTVTRNPNFAKDTQQKGKHMNILHLREPDGASALLQSISNQHCKGYVNAIPLRLQYTNYAHCFETRLYMSNYF